MFRGFKVDVALGTNNLFQSLQMERGSLMYKGYSENVGRHLREYIRSDNYLDGAGVQKAWFPQVKADVFISHSHNDKELAFTLAGWLHEHFGLSAFIDSAVWGYADELLKELDEIYCKKEDGYHFDYQDRNRSTSHVHMMLASAITSMIDRCECLFFLNTPSSLRFAEGKSITRSPWLYYEIGQSQTIRIKPPVRLLDKGHRHFSEGRVINKALHYVEYELDVSHLSAINTGQLLQWSRLNSQNVRRHPLDMLYAIAASKEVIK